MNKGKKKQPFLKRAAYFIADRGFYIVLFLCVAVIGAAAWILSSRRIETDVSEPVTMSGSFAPVETPALPDADIAEPPPAATMPPPAEDSGADIPDESEPSAETMAELPMEAAAPAVEEPAALHFLWPLSGRVETPHSVDALIYDSTMADWRTHSGVDISAPIGTLVMASSDGTVADVYDDGMYGTTVIIRHSGGLKSIYSNLAALPTVAAGDAVRIGEVIGAVGDTALAETGTVSHLHFGMELDGEAVDPDLYLPRR